MNVSVKFVKPRVDRVEMEIRIDDDGDWDEFTIPANQEVGAMIARAIAAALTDEYKVTSLAKSILEERGQIAIVWDVDDIRTVADEMEAELTYEECMTILRRIDHDFDASIGVNWDVLDTEVRWFVDERETDDD